MAAELTQDGLEDLLIGSAEKDILRLYVSMDDLALCVHVVHGDEDIPCHVPHNGDGESTIVGLADKGQEIVARQFKDHANICREGTQEMRKNHILQTHTHATNTHKYKKFCVHTQIHITRGVSRGHPRTQGETGGKTTSIVQQG